MALIEVLINNTGAPRARSVEVLPLAEIANRHERVLRFRVILSSFDTPVDIGVLAEKEVIQ